MYSNGFSDTGTGNTKTYGLIGSMANVPYITPDNYQGTVQVIVNYWYYLAFIVLCTIEMFCFVPKIYCKSIKLVSYCFQLYGIHIMIK